MKTITRALLGLVVGTTAVAGAVAACAAPHTAEGYVFEVRGVLPAADAGMMTDQQIIASGSEMCAIPGSLTTTGFENDAPPEYVEYSKITAAYCDVLPQAPAPGYGAGTAAPTSAAPQQVVLNQRFDILDNYGTKMADAAITSIEVDADCSESKKYSSEESKPERGHFVILAMDIATTAEFRPDQVGYPNPNDFTFTGPDGYTNDAVDAATAYCVPQDDTFDVMSPSRKYRGALTLDLKSTAGTLTYKPRSNSAWPGVTIALPAAPAAPATATTTPAKPTTNEPQEPALTCEPDAPARLVGNTIVNKDCPELNTAKENAQREYAEQQGQTAKENALRACREQTGMTTEQCQADAAAGNAN